MKATKKQSSRRGFLTGMLAGLGATSVAVAAGSRAKASGPSGAEQPAGEELYHRSPETERYYKTLMRD